MLALVAIIGCGAPSEAGDGLAPEERRAVRAVDRSYVEGWEANDPEAVMSTLAPDAVIVPDGMAPIRGDSAIRAYWWPRDDTETRVTAYATTVREVGGSGRVAYLRGRGDLAFDWRASAGDEWETFSSRSVWMALLRRDADGSWRMTHRMWHRVEE